MKNISIVLILLTVFAGAGYSQQISMDQLDHLQRANLYMLGETHDNPIHHLGQARVITAVKPKAVVFEMLTPSQAAKITPDLLKDEKALEQALGWKTSGWPEFSMYYPIFAALGDAKIYGAALPKDAVRRAFKEGSAAVFNGDAANFGLDRPLKPAELEQRKAEQFAAHCEAMPIEMMGGMVEAQRLRDAQFAATMVQAFEETGGYYKGLHAIGGPVVLIAGAGHTHYDWAVPSIFVQQPSRLSMISIAFIEGDIPPTKRYDFWIATERVDRKDPCLGFK